MRKILFIICLLLSFGKVKAQVNDNVLQIADEIDAVWDNMWLSSSPLAKLEATEYGELAIPQFAPNAYMKHRHKLQKMFDKSFQKAKGEDQKVLVDYFNRRLQQTIASGAVDQTILKEALLYLRLLPKEEIRQRTNIYESILLPIYYDHGDLKEIHYIAKMLEAEGLSTYDPENHLLRVAEEALAQYGELKERRRSEKRDLTGLWVSVTHEKLPKYLLRIHETDSAVLAILHPYSKKNSEHPKQFVTAVRTDSLHQMKLFFTNTQFKQGMDEGTVKHLGGMVNDMGESIVRNVNKAPNLSVGAQLGAQLGATLFSGLMMMALNASSVNTNTNTYIDITLAQTENFDQLNSEVKSKIEIFKSNSSVPTLATERNNYKFQRIYPDDELFFVKGRKCMVLGNPSRLAYLNKDYYNKIYADYTAHRSSHRIIKHVPWYILCTPYYCFIPYVLSDHGHYNKKVFNQIKKNDD